MASEKLHSQFLFAPSLTLRNGDSHEFNRTGSISDQRRKPVSKQEAGMVEGFAAVDGYSVWMRTGEKPLREGSFSLCFSLFPLGFSGGEDGIFSWLDRKEKKGFSVGLLKGGRVRIRFGNGKTLFGFDSINAHVRIREWNRIIVIFRQDAGWCDLYVNGVLSNRKQFLRHMRPAFPEGMAFLGKYADGDENSENLQNRGVLRIFAGSLSGGKETAGRRNPASAKDPAKGNAGHSLSGQERLRKGHAAAPLPPHCAGKMDERAPTALFPAGDTIIFFIRQILTRPSGTSSVGTSDQPGHGALGGSAIGAGNRRGRD